MNGEIMEHELSKLNGKLVSVVQPFFGSVSESWKALLQVNGGNYPIKFIISSDAGSRVRLFTADDVKQIDMAREIEGKQKINCDVAVAIIRFKGPNDYQNFQEEIPIGKP